MESNPKPTRRKKDAAKSPTAKTKPAHIYRLVDPLTGEIAYIGKTNEPTRRLAQHMKPRADQRMTPVKAWVASLVAQGQAPVMELIEVCAAGEWPARERHHIDAHRRAGHQLKNLAEGGDQPLCDPETRRANAKRLNQPGQDSLNNLLRFLTRAHRHRVAAGRQEAAVIFANAIKVVRQANGATRERFIRYAQEKFQ